MDRVPSAMIHFLEENGGNEIYIMRDDLLPFSFGGNKVRKAILFFEQIDAGGYTVVVTYGSSSSNHCRVIANMAAARGIKTHVVSTDGGSSCINRQLVEGFGAQIHICPVEQVAATIDRMMDQLRQQGERPFFIPGGGHGNTGTAAYDLAYDRICDYAQQNHIGFDYIFFASGTGTTHAGLISGMLRRGEQAQKIVGISIARKNPYGGQVVAKSVLDYTGREAAEALLFVDDYICGGYGQYDASVERVIRRLYRQSGVPLDPIYTGKAYAGMEQYLDKHEITGKRILFIHTGGTPIFCDWVKL